MGALWVPQRGGQGSYNKDGHDRCPRSAHILEQITFCGGLLNFELVSVQNTHRSRERGSHGRISHLRLRKHFNLRGLSQARMTFPVPKGVPPSRGATTAGAAAAVSWSNSAMFLLARRLCQSMQCVHDRAGQKGTNSVLALRLHLPEPHRLRDTTRGLGASVLIHRRLQGGLEALHPARAQVGVLLLEGRATAVSPRLAGCLETL